MTDSKGVKPGECETCKREVELTFHHLIPKKMQSKKPVLRLHASIDMVHYGIWVCIDCHKKIHKRFTHHQLATWYYSLPRLMGDHKFNAFVAWVSKQKKRVK